MPAFSLVYRPPPLPIRLLPTHIAPLPMYLDTSLNFGAEFSPVNLRRTTTRPVSYYALFE